MASISKTETKSGEARYIVRYRDPTGRLRERWFPRKAIAERVRAQVTVDVNTGNYIDPRHGQIPLTEWIEEHESTKVHRRPSTVARDRSLLDNHVLPAFGSHRIGNIRPVEVRVWVTALVAKGLSPDTVRKAHRLLSSALDAAADDGLIFRNPARRVDLPARERSDMRFLNVGEIQQLADTIDPRYRAIVLTAAYTGLRFGELAALQVNAVNPLRRRLQVDASLSEVAGQLSIGPPKSRAARRAVILPKTLIDEVARHLTTYPPGAEDLVFTSPTGGPLRKSNFRRRVWIPAIRASVGQPCRSHDLRHTHAALLIATGQHPKVIQERLGHASIRTTLDTYGHLFDGLDEAAANALDEAMRAPDVGFSLG